jgi:two-component system response regulator YesN
LENDRAQKRLNSIQKLLLKGNISKEEQDTFFPATRYNIGLCRKNGLPGSFSGIKRIFPPAFTAAHDTIDFYGKDDMECIHIEPGNTPFDPSQWDKVSWLNHDIPGYRTIVYLNSIPICELHHCIEELYNTLAHSAVIGRTQTIDAQRETNPAKIVGPSFSDTTFVNYLKENRDVKIKDLLHEQLELWNKSLTPQFRVKDGINSFFEQIRAIYPEDNSATPEDSTEYLIDDAFYYATGYDDLENNLLYILDKLLPGRELNISKIDTPEFFSLIEEYIKNKLAEPISLQQSCVHFGISQTYMSRLFRKYTGLSFTNYLTRSRIEKAKQYLTGGRTLIKDAAALTGYKDQFCFSKVFKSLTGLSPSDFINAKKQVQGIINE